jgi:Family of unknown function (DUF6282)
MTAEYNLFLSPPDGAQPADDLLKGAIDLHHHGYPEFTFRCRTRLDDADELAVCRDASMRGVVLKSHMWPTVGRAYLLRRLVPGIEIYPSITLNAIAGGFNPIAVESAAEQDARVMFMPTWGAANDIERGGFSRFMASYLPHAKTLTPDRGLRVTGTDGKVLPEVKECLAVAAQYKMLVCTAHIAPRESVALAAAAKDFGIAEIVFSHPDSKSVGASRDDIREMARLGAVIEFCINGFMPGIQRTSPATVMEIVGDVGADKVIFTTDSFYEAEPPGAEMMRIIIATMLRVGMKPDDLRKLVRTNPERLLHLST